MPAIHCRPHVSIPLYGSGLLRGKDEQETIHQNNGLPDERV